MLDRYRLPFLFKSEKLQADLAKILPQEWISHYKKADYEGEWTVVPLRSVQGSTNNLYVTSFPAICKDTSILKRCSYFRDVIKTLNCEKTTIRLMKLEPESIIKEHRRYGHYQD